MPPTARTDILARFSSPTGMYGCPIRLLVHLMVRACVCVCVYIYIYKCVCVCVCVCVWRRISYKSDGSLLAKKLE